MKKYIKSVIMAMITVALTILPSFAAADNPMTGDTAGRNMWIVFIILGVSLAVIIILAVTSGKKKK